MNFEWAHVIIGFVSALAGGGAGLIAGVWRVAHIEQELERGFQAKISAVKDGLEEKVESLVVQFEESFKGLRQKINDVELQTERLFMSKDGFNDFRKEYREDMQSLMKKIDHITVRADR
jgi:hypothetical protein